MSNHHPGPCHYRWIEKGVPEIRAKVRWPSELVAVHNVKLMHADGITANGYPRGEALHAYECPVCGGWHIGRNADKLATGLPRSAATFLPIVEAGRVAWYQTAKRYKVDGELGDWRADQGVRRLLGRRLVFRESVQGYRPNPEDRTGPVVLSDAGRELLDQLRREFTPWPQAWHYRHPMCCWGVRCASCGDLDPDHRTHLERSVAMARADAHAWDTHAVTQPVENPWALDSRSAVVVP